MHVFDGRLLRQRVTSLTPLSPTGRSAPIGAARLATAVRTCRLPGHAGAEDRRCPGGLSQPRRPPTRRPNSRRRRWRRPPRSRATTAALTRPAPSPPRAWRAGLPCRAPPALSGRTPGPPSHPRRPPPAATTQKKPRAPPPPPPSSATALPHLALAGGRSCECTRQPGRRRTSPQATPLPPPTLARGGERWT